MLSVMLWAACGAGPNLARGEADADDTLGGLAREALALGAESAGGDVELLSFRGSVNCDDGGRVPGSGIWWEARLRLIDGQNIGIDCIMDDGVGNCSPWEEQVTDLDPILDWTVDSPQACRRLPAEAEWLDVLAIGCLRADFCPAFSGVRVEISGDLPADRAAYYYHEVDDASLFPVTRVLDGVTGRMLYRDGV